MKRFAVAIGCAVITLAGAAAPANAAGAAAGPASLRTNALMFPSSVYMAVLGEGSFNGVLGPLHCQFQGTETASTGGVFTSRVDGNCAGTEYYSCNNASWTRVGTAVRIQGRCDDLRRPLDATITVIAAFEPIVIWPSTYAGAGTITVEVVRISCGPPAC